MDRLLGSIIDDYTLYKIIEGMIAILSLATIYLGIQIALAWKYIEKREGGSDIISQKDSFYRSTIFIFMAGLFMVIHEFLEGLEKDAPDYTTYEMFEFLSLMGLVLFLYEWHKILKKLKKKHFGTIP